MTTPSRIDRADRFLGRLYRRVLTAVLVLVSGACFWAGLTGARALDGGERWAVLALSGTAGVLFALFAWKASRKRRLSDILDDI